MTQDDLAISIGVSRKVVNELEGGKTTVHLEIAFKAAQALGIDLFAQARGEPDA